MTDPGRSTPGGNELPAEDPQVPVRLRSWIMVGVPLALVALFFASLVTFDGADNVSLVQASVTGQGAGRELAISLRNNSDQRYRRIGMTLQFVDASGEQVSAIAPETAGLEPGNTWDLRVPVPAGDASAYRILNVWCEPDGAPTAEPHDKPCDLSYGARL